MSVAIFIPILISFSFEMIQTDLENKIKLKITELQLIN